MTIETRTEFTTAEELLVALEATAQRRAASDPDRISGSAYQALVAGTLRVAAFTKGGLWYEVRGDEREREVTRGVALLLLAAYLEWRS